VNLHIDLNLIKRHVYVTLADNIEPLKLDLVNLASSNTQQRVSNFAIKFSVDFEIVLSLSTWRCQGNGAVPGSSRDLTIKSKVLQ
jgi:hypothetical protein